MTYHDYVTRLRARWGDRFSDAGLATKFAPYFDGPRIKVRTTFASGHTYERTGTVSGTTGWKPSLMLMHRSNATGSSDLLHSTDEIVAVKRGRTYHPTTGDPS